jgi:hypothetical protein
MFDGMFDLRYIVMEYIVIPQLKPHIISARSSMLPYSNMNIIDCHTLGQMTGDLYHHEVCIWRDDDGK